MRKVITIFMLVFLCSSFVYAQKDGDNLLFGAKYITNPRNAKDTLPSGVDARSVTFVPASTKLNGQDLAHILVPSYSRRIFDFQQVSKNSLDFKLVWVSPKISTKAGVVGSNPRSCEVFNDLDGNGKPEIGFIMRGTLRDTVETDTTVTKGIRLFEWDGIANSNNYTLSGTIRIDKLDDFYKTSTLGNSEKGLMSSYDIDGDGNQELIFWPNTYGFSKDPKQNGGRLFIVSVESGNFKDKTAKLKTKYVYNKMAACFADSSDGFVPVGHVLADVDGDGKKEIVVLGRTNNGTGAAIGLIKYNFQTKQYIDGSIVDLTDYTRASGTLRNMFRVTAVAGVLNNSGRDHVIFNTDDNLKRVIMLTDVIDIELVGPNNIVTLKVLPEQTEGNFVGTAIGDQDHGTGTDGFDIYFPTGGGVEQIGDLEYKGTGSIADSNSYNYYNIFDARKILKNGNGGIYTVINPGYDIDGNGKKEIICNFQPYGPDTLVNGKVPLYTPPPFFVLEWGDTSSPTLEVKKINIFTDDDYKLEQNFPNPFNPTTNIRFSLPTNENINLIVYDINGREIKTLINNKEYEKGSYEVTWDAKDNFGKAVSSGVYFTKLKWGNFEKSMKMSFLK